MATKTKTMPAAEQKKVETPTSETIERKMPLPDMSVRAMPPVGSPENTVMIGGKLIEIKPMKLKYMRNRTAAFRHILEAYPLADILAMDGQFGDGRDGDKALYDWLVAVTDNEDLIRENYDDIDSETIYKMLSIHKRLDKVEELEAKIKNSKAPGED